MIPVMQIISHCQNEINDLSSDKIQLGEYRDLFNDTLREIASKTEIWVARYQTTPYPANSSAPANPIYGVTIPSIDPTTSQALSPYLILRAMRSVTDSTTNSIAWEETKEFSWQAIGRLQSGHPPFTENMMGLPNGAFATMFMNNGTIDDSRTLMFVKPFEMGESVIIDFIQQIPFLWADPITSSNMAIPDHLHLALVHGLLWRLFERLFNKGDETAQFKADRQKSYYDVFLKEAMYYSRMMMDKQSTLQTKPQIWLPE